MNTDQNTVIENADFDVNEELSLEDIEALGDDVTADDVTADDVTFDDAELAALEEETVEGDDAAALAGIEDDIAGEEKQAAYEAQESNVSVEDEDTVEKTTQKAKKGQKAKPAESGGDEQSENTGPKRKVFEKESEAIRYYMGEQPIVLDATTPEDQYEAQSAAVLAEVDATKQKKVREKAVNAFWSVATQNPAKLSKYTKIAISVLRDKGSVTGPELKAAMADHMAASTASAQSGQMLSLLPLLRIANKDGKTLVLNENSVLADIFVA